MAKFGHVLYAGGRLPFDTDIIIENGTPTISHYNDSEFTDTFIGEWIYKGIVELNEELEDLQKSYNNLRGLGSSNSATQNLILRRIQEVSEELSVMKSEKYTKKQ